MKFCLNRQISFKNYYILGGDRMQYQRNKWQFYTTVEPIFQRKLESKSEVRKLTKTNNPVNLDQVETNPLKNVSTFSESSPGRDVIGSGSHGWRPRRSRSPRREENVATKRREERQVWPTKIFIPYLLKRLFLYLQLNLI